MLKPKGVWGVRREIDRTRWSRTRRFLIDVLHLPALLCGVAPSYKGESASIEAGYEDLAAPSMAGMDTLKALSTIAGVLTFAMYLFPAMGDEILNRWAVALLALVFGGFAGFFVASVLLCKALVVWNLFIVQPLLASAGRFFLSQPSD